jgi:energy-coupling factor transporter ATP-binding protein EcfA2
MYIRKASLKNVRSISEMDWAVQEGEEAGWHVILGDNGSGKSSFLRALALGLVGPRNAEALRLDWNEWITRGTDSATIQLQVGWDTRDLFSGSGNVPRIRSLTAGLELRLENGKAQVNGIPKSGLPLRGIWGSSEGWFSASYGPFRRFAGGDAEFASLSLSRPKLAAHLSLFGENYALTEALRWLQDLNYRRKDNRPEGRLLDGLIGFVNNSGLLPHQTILREVSSDGVVFEDGNGAQVPVQELSDGYRSILSLTFELIRQLSQSYGWERVFEEPSATTISLPGVVLIDEVDVHLHPAWQQRIGAWFLKFFPRLQFIVTTHSPIICQAAGKGSVWRLPEPGSEEPPRRLEGTELERLLYGNVLDAYGTGLFGRGVTRSEAGKQRVRQLAELNVRSVEGPLSEPERTLQRDLLASTPTAGAALTDEG